MKNICILFLLVFCLFFNKAKAQNFELPEAKKFEKVNFRLINNLIIIPLEVNGTELSFILDSGVGKPILFNISDKDSIQINNVSEITIQGLGAGEPIKALSSSSNNFSIGNLKNDNQHLFVVMDKNINFSPSLGVPIHGIIGYELFRDMVVDINYGKKIIKFYRPGTYTKNNSKNIELPIDILQRKVYLEAEVAVNEKENHPVKLLIDTGSSDALWLFQNKNISVPEKHYEDYLGMGLGGDIYGKRTKISSISIGSFVIHDAKTAFPEMEIFNNIKNLGNRNGSIGGEILKRFNIVFDYRNKKIFLRKNRNFGRPFHFNFSGLELQHNGVRYVSESIQNTKGLENKKGVNSFGNVQLLLENSTRLSLVPEIVISAIRVGSPAETAGLKEGDVILAVNGKKVHSYKLQEVTQMLNEKEGSKIRLLIERYNKDVLFSFVLKNMFK